MINISKLIILMKANVLLILPTTITKFHVTDCSNMTSN